MAGPHAGNRNRPAYSGQARFRFPPQIIELFAARKPLDFKPPMKRRKLPPMTGVSSYVSLFEKKSGESSAKAEGVKVNASGEAASADRLKDEPVAMEAADANDGETKMEEAEGSIAEPAKREAVDAPVPTVSKKRAVEEPSSPSADPTKRHRPRSPPFETPVVARIRKRTAAAARARARVSTHAASWDPFAEGGDQTRDAYNTLFVAGFARDALPARLRAEFENYGPVVRVVVPRDRRDVPRGYAFVEFEREADLKVAYKEAAGRKIDGRRVVVDVERGRTVKNWRPNRLDGPNNTAKHPPATRKA